MLELIPAGGVPAGLRFTNVAMAAEVAGVTLPQANEPIGPFNDELRSSGAVLGLGNLAGIADQPELWRPVVGIEPADVAESLSVRVGPFSFDLYLPVEAIELSDIEARAAEDSAWFPDLQRVETGYGEYLDWNVDDDQATDFDRSSGARPLGRGGQVGIVDDAIVWSAFAVYVEQTLRVAATEDPRLADNALIVELLADYDGPAPQAFWLDFDPVNQRVAMVMNVPGDGGYTAVALFLDPANPGDPILAPAIGTAAISQVGNVIRIDLGGPESFRTLFECSSTKTCISGI